MKIQITGRKILGSGWNNASCCTLLFILVLSVTPIAKAKAGATPDSLKALPARTLSDIAASQENGRLTVTIKMNRLLEPTVFTVENPTRLVLDFPDTINRVPFKKLPLNAPSVRRVRVGQFKSANPRIARVVFDLGEGFGTHRISLDKSSVQVTFLPEKTIADQTGSTSGMNSKGTTSTAVKSISQQKSGIQTRSGVSSVKKGSGQTAARSQEIGISSVRDPATAGRSGLTRKSGSSPGEQDFVQSSSRLSQTPQNKTATTISTEDRASSSEAKLPAGIQAQGAPATHAIQASLEKNQEVPERNTRLPAIATRVFSDPSPRTLGETLDQIGKSVEQFRKQFESVACTEFVSQTKLGERNSVLYKKDHEFDYMIITDIRSNGMRVEESRKERRAKGKTKDLPLLVTEGFPTLLLIFHPYYQGSFEYQDIGETVVEGRKLMKIAFRHIRGERSTSVLHLEGENYPLELKGTAWIDPVSNNIRRIRAELVKPMAAVGLQMFNSDVRYMPMKFASNAPTYWMPETATVEVMTRKQHWRNVHRFEDYRLFSVSSEDEITLP